ncbi:MAG: TetR/AcrR family transcriptional regulator [Clostridia bacterium]|nr:TetR/AcrR family transcriptional regulator [Clostridia bacterium]
MTKKESKEKRINDILEAAMDVFIEKGYENASMNEIAARAGISKGGLYHHFLNKDMVMLYANQKLMEPCEAMMEQIKNYKSVVEGLKFYISHYLKYWSDRKRELIFFSLSMTKAMSMRDIFKMYEQYVEKYISSFEAFYQKGIDQGEFIPHNTRNSAIALMSALDGVVVYMALDKKLKLEEVSKSFEERLVDPFILKGEQ